MKFTNEHDIGLSQAVFLAHDEYDYDPRPNAVSATGMLKSTRQAILSRRAEAKIQTMDISQLVAASLGTAVHDSVEKAWSHGNYKRALKKLGYPQKKIDRVVVNHGYLQDPKTNKWYKDPNAKPMADDAIPVYMEIRSEKQIDDMIITGKYDFVGNGVLEDHKTTGVFTYIKNTKSEDYKLQGSIYRWLNPDIITEDYMVINYVFTDWSKLRYMIEKDQGYPPFKMMSVRYTLLSLEETETYIRSRIKDFKDNLNKPEPDLPLCTSEELWQDSTVYKYYKNPQNKQRATKNFDTFAEAQTRLMKDGSIGVIDIVPAKAKACLYCPASAICSQARQLAIDGQLDMEF